jgi:hypothetical protein
MYTDLTSSPDRVEPVSNNTLTPQLKGEKAVAHYKKTFEALFVPLLAK